MLSDSIEKLRAAVRDIPDFPKPGILFRDITPLLADPSGLALAIVVIFLLLTANYQSVRLSLITVSTAPAVIGGRI